MLTILIGTDWTANTDVLMNMICADVASGQSGRILMVPELISHETERMLCTTAGPAACRFAEVLSFTRLAQRVSETVGHGMEECLDAGGRLVAMASAARQLHGHLKSYAAVETRPEFLTGLIEAIDEFKRCCIYPEDLSLAAKKTEGALAQKLEELSLLYDAYDAICLQGKRDPRDQMTWLLEQLEDSDFAQRHVFYIDGFPDFTRQHMSILEHIISNAPQVILSLNCDSIDSMHPAFQKAGATAGEILRFAKHKGIDVSIYNVEARRDALAAVRKKLLQGTTEHEPKLDGNLMVCRAKSAYEECQAAAEWVFRKIATGARYRDIAVVCTDVTAYRDTLRFVFDRFRIPTYLSGTEEILSNAAISTVLTAIDVAIGGFEQADVIRYVKSPLLPIDIHVCDQIENYAIMWDIRGKQWQNEWVNNPHGLKDQMNDHEKVLLNTLNQHRKLIVDPLARLQKGIRDAVNVKEQVVAVYHFLDETHYAQRLQSLAEEMDQNADNRSAQILNQLWDILLSALEQLYDVLGDTYWDSENFHRLFRLLLSQYDVGTIPPMLDSVTVGPISAMRCKNTKHLIVLGAGEGSLPGYSGASGVLTDRERTELRSLGIPLTGGAMEGVLAEFAEIYGVFCGAQVSVYISHSSGHPSSIYQRLKVIAGGEQSVSITLGPAYADPLEACALLVRHEDHEGAAELNLSDGYQELKSRCDYQYGSIDLETVKKLYGEKLNLSASQVDKKALCSFAYFIRYGMQAKERKAITVDPAEFGTFVHAVLEETACEVMERGGFKKVSLDETLEIARDRAEAYTINHFSQIDSDRLTYLFRRNSQELEFVVREFWEELNNSEFVPVGFEVAFGEDGSVGPIKISDAQLPAQLRGFVDRVDQWKDERNNYFKIVDYKTGRKDFDYCDVFNGLNLQMLLYLFALEDNGEDVIGSNASAAGIQYFPARAPYILVDGMQDVESIADSREKVWKRKGLLLNNEKVLSAMDTQPGSKRLCFTVRKDGKLSGDLANVAQFRLLKAYVFMLLGNIVDQIASGTVDPDPYTRGSNDNPCRFCEYGQICHPASVSGRRNYKSMSADEFWERVERAVKDCG